MWYKQKQAQGFTLVELLIAMVISLIVMGAIYGTFKSQQDSFLVQSQVTSMQQNLRAGMYVMSRDIQMAGYITNLDTRTYTTISWDPTVAANEVIRPLIYGRNNDAVSGNGVKDNTDVLVIIKASNDPADSRQLTAGDSVTSTTLTLSPFDLNLDASTYRFGVLVKSDLSRAEIFEVQSIAGNTVTFSNTLQENYGTGDRVYRADVITYKIDEDTDHPSLQRWNQGNGSGFQTVAEDIDNLQLQYVLADGSKENIPAQWADVRAVQVSLLARTERVNRGYTNTRTYTMGDQAITPGDSYRRKLLSSLVKTRNVGL